MRTTKQFSITLPHEMADLVASKVQAGEYASESEVIRDGLRALIARDKAVEAWLHHEIVPVYDSMVRNPGQALSVSAVRDLLSKRSAP